LQDDDLKDEESPRVPLLRDDSLQLFHDLFNESFSNSTGRHIISV
jgi:hypothetical protein